VKKLKLGSSLKEHEDIRTSMVLFSSLVFSAMVGICYGNKDTQFLIIHQFFQYPIPKTITWQELAARYTNGTNEPGQQK
jgi:hypothetical protein